MNLFNKNPDTADKPLLETSYVGFWLKVYANRVEFKAGVGRQSIPLSQIASIDQGMMGVWKIVLETTGGKRYNVPTSKKKEVAEAIYAAQAALSQPAAAQSSTADELTKLATLKDQGILTQDEFDAEKKRLLG